MPGTGMNAPNRYVAIISNVNSTLFRRSGMRKTLRKVPIGQKPFGSDGQQEVVPMEQVS